MTIKATLIISALIVLGLTIKQFSNSDQSFQLKKTAPKMTLWRVDSMHLLDESKGLAEFWPCDSEYYFNYKKNITEDIIIDIKNEGDADLILSLPLTFASGSFGPVSIVEQPHHSVLASGEESHFIVRHSGESEYNHSEAIVIINNNDPQKPVCNINFEVGDVAVCGFGLIDFISESVCNNNNTPSDPNDDFYTTDIDISYVNRPSSGNLELTGTGLLSPVAISAASLGASRDTLVGVQIKADGTPQQITFHFTNNGCAGSCPCNDDFAFPEPVLSCSEICTDCPNTNYYVDAGLITGTLNSALEQRAMAGTSWDMAFTTLEAALAVALPGDTIRVAEGTYYPYNGPTDEIFGGQKSQTFQILDSMVLLGGYPAGGSPDSMRNWQCFKTILCGDIDQNGQLDNTNSYHVITTDTVSDATTVDGFCIQNGNANTSGDDRFGGGWLNRGRTKASNPTIRNCIFQSNNALRHGGAMANYGDGGEASPIIINTIFRGNTAGRGGAMYNYGAGGISNPSLVNSILSGNQAIRDATNATTLGNRPGFGGAMYNDGSGGICIPTIVNTVFNGNLAYRGGAMYNVGSDGSTLASAALINSIFWNNSGTNQANVVYNENNAVTNFIYSIIQGTSNDINHSTITGGATTSVNLGNNKFQSDGADPMFINSPAAGLSLLGDFHLMPTSDAIDMGDNIPGSITDLDGNNRIFNGTIDIGAYEKIMNVECSTLGSVIYVDSAATGLNNGSSWANAFTDLNDALMAVKLCGVDSVKVAQGTYYPSDTMFVYDECTNQLINTVLPDRAMSFEIPDSAVVLGGYEILAGAELGRDWECNKTILCGDFQQDGDSSNNSYHVVTTTNVSEATVVDGFCITGGNANTVSFNTLGGGWYNKGRGTGNSSNPTVINCIISRNSAEAGGGGMYNDGGFQGNSSPILINVVISGNEAYDGGGMYNAGEAGMSSPILTNVVISGNKATNGGGMLNSGGAVDGQSSPILTNVVISGNKATNGGGMLSQGISGNSDPVLINCILWNNLATAGGNAFANGNDTIYVYNSIIQGSSNDINGGSITFNFPGGYTFDGGNNKFQSDGIDPMFIKAPLATAAPTAAGNFHVLSSSPAIDMGDDAAIMVALASYKMVDLDDTTRIINKVDIGPYELQSPNCSDYGGVTTIYVDSSAAAGGNGKTWDSAFTDLQDALLVAKLCGVDSILVAQGTYYPSVTIIFLKPCGATPDTVYPNRATSFDIPDSTVVMGGYLSGGSDARDWVCNKTILCGEIQQDGDNSNNSYHVVTTTNVSEATVVDGFCITGGNANTVSFNTLGGGWYNKGRGTGNSSNPTVINCIISRNSAEAGGGGMYNDGGFQGNSSPILINVVISGNEAYDGGGMYNAGEAGMSSPILTNVVISGNKATNGGGMLNSGGAVDGQSSPILTNVVISGNKATNGGGMLSQGISGNSDPVLINCILWNNLATAGGNAFANGNDTIYVYNSIIQGSSNDINGGSITFNFPGGYTFDGGNNKFQSDGIDPMFIKAPLATAAPTAAGNFHVLSSSPAIDMGDDAAIMVALASYKMVDLDDTTRIVNKVDIGPYELQSPNCNDYAGVTTIYVDSSAAIGGHGKTWDSAFTDLQDALLVAKLCGVDSIKVAQGTYYPSDTIIFFNPCGAAPDTVYPNRATSFDIPDSTVVMGGYLSGGSDARDWVCNKTILCGEIQQDGDNSNNSYHVVTTTNVSEATVVDGFCITGGNANTVSFNTLGGGWYNKGRGTGNSSNPTVINCIISRNSAEAGGGGMYNDGGFQGNSSPILINVVISGNEAYDGGGMYNAGEAGMSSPILTNVVISGNKATNGGGMLNSGGAVDGQSSPILTNVVISGNKATNGGGMLSQGISGNSDPVLINCILWNNLATAGGNAFANGNDTIYVYNSIIQGSSNDINGGSITFNFPGGYTFDGGNNKFQSDGIDPMFIKAPLATAAPTAAGNFHVLSSSPAIDMGDDAAIMVALASYKMVDLDDTTRIVNKVDIGPYELQSPNCNDYAGVTTIYVDSSAAIGGHGKTWDSAFTDLQDALLVAKLCGVDSIKVAQGTYYPSDTIIFFNPCGAAPDTVYPNRATSFDIPDSTVVMGGYLSGGSDARDWQCNKTILCGDIDRNNDTSGNSYHVVVTTNVSEATVVDGFCITGGNAFEIGTFPNVVGGGWYNDGSGSGNRSNPNLRNIVISGNFARVGGGMYNNGINGISSPILTNVVISGNTALAGGGMLNNGEGGTSSPILTNLVIGGNDAQNGGGMFNNGVNGTSSPILTNVVISGNKASSRGGGIYNRAADGSSSPILTNVVISGNKAVNEGGGIYNFAPEGTSSPILTNCILWNNVAILDSIISENDGSITTITYSIIQSGRLDGGTDTTGGTNKPGVDPLFINAPAAGLSTAGDFHVLPGSPAIDMGDNSAPNIHSTDLDGKERIINSIVDMGAYEFGEFIDCSLYTDVVYVDSAATGANNGTSWADAFTDLQDGLAVVRAGCVDTVKVAQGTYYPSDTTFIFEKCNPVPIDTMPPDRSVSFNIPNSAVLLGGYGHGADSVNRDWQCNKTILCGDIDMNGDTMNNSYHVVVTINVDSTTVVDGFCITGGNANGTASNNLGGGWFNDGSGGGNSSNPTVINCKITGNHASRFGGGMNNNGLTNGNSSPTLINCIISGNSSLAGGGGINNNGFGGNSSPLLTNCLIVGNFSNGSGGGIVNFGSNGGNSSPVLTNCVVSGNFADIAGGALNNNGTNGNSTPLLINCILWNNRSMSDSVISENNSTTIILYSIIQAGTFDVETNISASSNKIQGTDPSFINAPLASAAPTTVGDFHVSCFSPAIDMGDNAANTELTDLDGLLRKINTIDIGVYEFQGPECSLFTSNTIYVDSTNMGTRNGNSWMTAYHCLQDALLAAKLCSNVDTIKVAKGTYFPSKPDTLVDECTGAMTIIPISRSDFFFLPDGITLLGGYPTGGEMNGPRDPHCHFTILSGDINHDVDSMGNTHNVVKTIDYADTITFDGFVIEHGNAIPNVEEGGAWWDGSFHDSAMLCIRNTIFRDNYAIRGGAFYAEGTKDLKISHSEFYQNTASDRGGAIYFTPPMVLAGDTAKIVLDNNLIYQNTAPVNGGGIAITFTSGMFLNIVNTTVSQNTPDAFNNNSTGIVNIYNSILWNNGGGITGSVAPTLIMNSIVTGIAETNGNKNQNPLFIDPNSNFRLDAGSPAINMGDNTFVQDSTDLDGLPRITFTSVDMGAYETILNCSNDTLYVEADGDVPSLPLDSIMGIELTPECMLFVNGVNTTSDIPFSCDQLGINTLNLLLIKPNCTIPDTLYNCTITVQVTDSFPKELNGSDQVNVSLNDMCMKVITADDVLKNVLGCRNAFEVELVYPQGTNTYDPPVKLDRSHLGYCMTYVAIDKLTGNKTWGKICVEDKKGPEIECFDDTITCFELANLPADGSLVTDACSGTQTKLNVISETFTDYGCDSAIYGIITRRLVASDQWGNTVDCTRKLYIEKLSLDSIVCPVDVEIACTLAPSTTPTAATAPKVKTKDGLTPLFGNTAACKLSATYKDERHNGCGNSFKILRTWTIVDWCTGKEKECKQWIEVIDTTAPVVTSKTLTDVQSKPHECGQYVKLDTLVYTDCNKVKQTYTLSYNEEGTVRVIRGDLNGSSVWLPVGPHTINVLLVDACNNSSTGTIKVTVLDETPPTPICDEFTQVTVDPLTCWTSVAAKDLDNGSRDNCCEVLHFAAAHMDSITYWRDYWNTRLETEVGKEAFWKDKAKYDEIIEEWINCYVFADSVHFDECGTNQVVLRVYEACGVPRYDPHIFPCSPHAWFCYNTYLYMGDFNFNWFDANGPKSCKYRPVLTSLAKTHEKYIAYQGKGYLAPKYVGAAQFDYCEPPFHVAFNGDENLHRDTKCPKRLYSDCMVQVLVDDKQAPVAYGLEDITVYCDGTIDALDPDCGYGDKYTSSTWPLDIKDHTGSKVNRIHSAYGYYGGSSFLDIHVAAGDHEDPQACEQNKGWAPIYCRSWLLLDSTDEAGKRDYTKLFDKLLLFDKGRKQTAELKQSEFSITDNCRLNDASLKVENAGTVNSCGEGWLSRTWTIEDKCGNKVSATQKIYIKKRSDFEVIFPEDKVVTCDFLNRTDTTTRGAGRPVISDDECEQVGMQYKDEIFTVEDSACYKIVRTWTIIDWCTYDPNQHDHPEGSGPDVIVDDRLRADSSARSCVYRHIKDNNDGFMRYIQIIKVIDEIAPVVTCSDQTVCIDAACSTTVNIPLVGTDNCADEVVFRVEITKPDGSKETRANIKAITGTVVEGIYSIKIIGNDRCGNEDTCDMKLTVKDCKKPTPYCIDGIATVIMPNSGTIELWAKDFNIASEDNCTAKGDLKYSFSKEVTQASKVFTCADIIDGKLQGLIVEMWVTDKAGNQDLCKVSLQLQDNSSSQYPTGACKDTTASVAGVTGRLITEENEGVEKANVEILPTGTPSQALSYSSKVDGSYAFNGMPITSASYTLKAKRDDEPMNGVSTIDLVLIQKHILGTESLKTPYKMIAADANNDKDITAVDLVELRKLILGVYDKLPNNTSWKFVPKSYAFTDIQNPWSYPTEEVLTQMSNNIVKDFVGVKVGDVNASSIPHSLMGTEVRESTTGLIFELEDQTFKAGDKVEVSFRSPNFAGVSGFQGTIQSTMYEVQRTNVTPYLVPNIVHGPQDAVRTSYVVTSGALNLTDKNFGTRWANEGLVTMSWNTNTGIDINSEEVLFTMTFVAQKAGVLSEVMHIGSQRTKAESYEGKGELGNLSLRFVKNGKEISGSNTLYQNYPNPFDQRTVIGLNLAKLVNGTLKITDVTGKVVKEINREWNKGYNEVLLSKGEIKSKGILFYSFESNEFNATKRMIVIE